MQIDRNSFGVSHVFSPKNNLVIGPYLYGCVCPVQVTHNDAQTSPEAQVLFPRTQEGSLNI